MSYLPTLNSLLTSTTSRYANLRRNLLSSTSEDDTGITDPESSHVSRVLRAYYIEKNRPFPPWLGLDPRDAAKAQQQQQQQARPLGSLRGTSSASTSGSEQQRSSGGLGDLWGDGAMGGERDLRRGVLGRGRGEREMEGAGARPLPSQRMGSLQGAGVGAVQGGGGGSARERLRERLNRGGSGRSTPEGGEGGTGSYATEGLSGWQGRR